MKFLLTLTLFLSAQVFAWELPQTTGADEIRYLHERQEVLVKSEAGVWRYDVQGRLIRSPSTSTQKLWDVSSGKAPASLSKVHAVYAPAAGVVFVLVPESENVQVLKLR